MNKIIIEHLNLQYSDGTESLRDINLEIPANAITVLFGPAGGGKVLPAALPQPPERPDRGKSGFR